MQLVLHIVLLCSQLQQATDLRLGSCIVHVERGTGAQPDVIRVTKDGQRLWSGLGTSGSFEYRAFDDVKRFVLSLGGSRLLIFTHAGELLRDFEYLAFRDPRPILFSPSFTVIGLNIFNWKSANGDSLGWVDHSRKFYAIELAAGKIRELPKVKDLGLPIFLEKSTLVSVVPKGWHIGGKVAGKRTIVVRTHELYSGRIRKSEVRCSDSTYNALLQICLLYTSRCV